MLVSALGGTTSPSVTRLLMVLSILGQMVAVAAAGMIVRIASDAVEAGGDLGRVEPIPELLVP
jgi:hypothetical protein